MTIHVMDLGVAQNDKSLHCKVDNILNSQGLSDSAEVRQVPPDKRSSRWTLNSTSSRTSTCNKTIKGLQRIEETLREDKTTTRWTWVESIWMNSLFGFVILLNSLCIGLDIELSDENGNQHPYMMVVESIFLVCFWGELLLRLLNRGLRQFCADPWGPFDAGVTLLGSLDAWVLTPFIGGTGLLSGLSALRTLRLLRLARLARAFRYFKELARLLRQINSALRALGWVSLLTLIAIYISVVLSVMLVDCNNKASSDVESLCSGIGWAFYYHLYVVTGEGYIDALVDPTVAISPYWYGYWMFVVAVLNFCMVHMILGIVCEKAMTDRKIEDENAIKFVHEARAFRQALLTLCNIEDANKDGVLDAQEMSNLLKNVRMQKLMETFGINADVPAGLLLTVLGIQGDIAEDKCVSFDRFCESCVRVCGAGKDIRSFMLQYDVGQLRQEVSSCVSRIIKGPDTVGATSGSTRGRSGTITAAAPSIPSARPALPPSLVKGVSPLRKAPPSTVKASEAKFGSKRLCICRAGKASDFTEGFAKKARLATRRLSELERRQEEMILQLGELRQDLFGSSGAVCCPKGHLLLPLGTTSHPVGDVEYRYWSCDCADGKDGPCSHGQVAGSHLSKWRRYHCARCRYDMCELCYQHRLWGGKPPPDLLSWLPAPSLPHSQWWESTYQQQPGKHRPKVAKGFAQQPLKGRRIRAHS